MLSFLIDIVGAFFAARHIRGLGFLILASLLIGFFSAVCSNLLIYFLAMDSFTPKEILTRIIFGAVIHPVVTTIASLLFRRFFRKRQ